MLAVLVHLVVVPDQPHEDSLPVALRTSQTFVLRLAIEVALCDVAVDGVDSGGREVGETEGQGVDDEAGILIEELSIHLLQENEVLADFVGEVNVLEVELQILFVLDVTSPNPYAFAETHHLLPPAEERQLALPDVAELEFVLY